jgi:uncharacterized protein
LEKFLPHRATIEQFGSGGFRFAGMSHQGSLLILPSGMRAWSPLASDDVEERDFAPVLAELADIDFLLIGTGPSMARLPQGVNTRLASLGIRFDVMSTSAAIHTYNVVLAEDRRVAAALIAVDRAHG